MSHTSAIVRIQSVPHGEAPLWVREKWVGLELPTVLRDGTLVASHTFGVLSGPQSNLRALWAMFRGQAKRESGFPVPVTAALQALEVASPEAAEWWRLNAAHLVNSRNCFVFEASCGQICEDAA